MKNKLLRGLAVLAGACMVIVVLLMLFENRMVYPAPSGGNARAADFGGEDVVFESSDGTSLHGWYFENEGSEWTIVFFHGNAESIEHSGPRMGEFASRLNASLFIFDYRGYGKSQGKPREPGVVADGIAAVRWLRKRTGKPSEQLVFLGRSLGGGVAIQVARQERPRALILVSTFSSLVDVAQAAFRWLPVRWLMKNRFESAKTLGELDIPLLQFHGGRDQMIPVSLGKKLFEASPARRKQFITLDPCGHNDLSLDLCRDAIIRFLKSL